MEHLSGTAWGTLAVRRLQCSDSEYYREASLRIVKQWKIILTWTRDDGDQEVLTLNGVEPLHFRFYEVGLFGQKDRGRGSEFLIVGRLRSRFLPQN